MMRVEEIIALPLATVVYPNQHPLAGQTDVVNAYALRRPAGVILVDSGVGMGSAAIDERYQPARLSLEAALGRHALAIADVVALVNTHLHFDHCGQNRIFPAAPIYVQDAEYRAAQEPGFTVEQWVNFPGASYRRVSGEVEIAPGIRLLPTPGHTPGHQSVLIETDGGRVVIAGQAVQSRADFACLHQNGDLPPEGEAPDQAAYRASARRLLDAAPRRVYFSHDRAVWTDAVIAPD